MRGLATYIYEPEGTRDLRRSRKSWREQYELFRNG